MMIPTVFSILTFCYLIVASVSYKSNSPKVMNYRQLEKRILDRILMPNIYDSQIRPKGVSTNVTETDGPTKVTVNLFVRSFEKIDDVKMEFSVQITFRQLWNDNRLAFNNMGGKIKYLTMTERDKVWMPDTFFRNEKARGQSSGRTIVREDNSQGGQSSGRTKVRGTFVREDICP